MYNRVNEMSRAKTLSRTRVPARKRLYPKELPKTGPFVAGKKLNAILCLLLAAVTIALYGPVLEHSFIVLDDSDYVTANPHIHQGLGWSTVKWAFTSTAAANWHPLTWLSHALDYQIFALNPAGHHLDSVLIHAANAVLLFLLLGWITRRVGPSLLVAALFALHPINVESVAWVAERKNVLSMFFFLAAICAYVRYARKPDWRRYLLVAALFALGLMAKPMVITLPFVLLLLDYWPLGRTAGSLPPVVPVPQSTVPRLLLEKIPLLALSAASALITLRVQRAGYAVRTLIQFPLAVRIENAIVAYGLYLWKTLWPTRLALYPHPAMALPAWQWMLSALALTAITVLVVIFRSKRYLPVGWFWFLGTLVPVIGLVQVGEGAMADRYAYLPLIGIFVMVAFGLADLAEARAVPLPWRVIPALCVLLALSLVTHRQMSYWASDYDLWSHTLAVAENPFAHDAMGSALLDSGLAITSDDQDLDTAQKRMEVARQHFERALELRRQLAQQNPAVYLPDMATTLNNLGNLDRLQNRPEEARRHYEEALKIHRQLAQQNLEPFPPDLAVTLNNLGSLERANMQLAEAGSGLQECAGDLPSIGAATFGRLPAQGCRGAEQPGVRGERTKATGRVPPALRGSVGNSPSTGAGGPGRVLALLGDNFKRPGNPGCSPEPNQRGATALPGSLEGLPSTGAARSGHVLAVCGSDAEQPGFGGRKSEPHRRISRSLPGRLEPLPEAVSG